MLHDVDQFEVLRPVVRAVAVSVMDLLIRRDGAMLALPNHAMLEYGDPRPPAAD
jgi:hypothetical protein